MTALAAFLAARKKAIAAFLAPIILAQLARIVPGAHLDVSLVEQIITAVITGAAAYLPTNTKAG